MINQYTEDDLVYVRIIRGQVGKPWEEARPAIVERLPEGYSEELLPKFIDTRPNPGIHINAWGLEPRFYTHRTSGRLLEFYRSVG